MTDITQEVQIVFVFVHFSVSLTSSLLKTCKEDKIVEAKAIFKILKVRLISWNDRNQKWSGPTDKYRLCDKRGKH